MKTYLPALAIVISVLLAMAILATNANSETTLAGQITYVEKDDPMPYTGFAVDKPQMRHFRQINEEKMVLDKKVVKLEELRYQHEAKIDFLEDEYALLDKEYKAEQRRNTWNKVFYFAGGVLLSGAAVYGASKLRR